MICDISRQAQQRIRWTVLTAANYNLVERFQRRIKVHILLKPQRLWVLQVMDDVQHRVKNVETVGLQLSQRDLRSDHLRRSEKRTLETDIRIGQSYQGGNVGHAV